MSQSWEERVTNSVARTVAAQVIDQHDIPLKGAVAVEIRVGHRMITGTICSSEEHVPDVETDKARFTEQSDLDKITSLTAGLLGSTQSFCTRTRDGSVMWTIGAPAEDSTPPEF